MFATRLGIVGLVFGLTASGASAQGMCGSRVELLKLLGEKYTEAPSGFGTIGDKALIEVYVSDKGTFTIVASKPDGTSCILAAGQNWEKVDPPKKKLTSL